MIKYDANLHLQKLKKVLLQKNITPLTINKLYKLRKYNSINFNR